MTFSLEELQTIIDKKLPKPGSPIFDSCYDTIEVPLYRNVGWLSTVKEGDPSGMTSGIPERISELVETLVFKKNMQKKCWEITIDNEAPKKRIVVLEDYFSRLKNHIIKCRKLKQVP